LAEIRFNGITKVFDKGKAPAVDSVDLTVADGEFMVLLGPSGCGKTTLLRMLAGLEHPTAGRVQIGDRDVTDLPPRKREIAMVFQSYAVFPHLKVADNIGFGLRMRGMDRSQIRETVEWAAGLVQLDEFLDRYPAQLSGGQRQRVAVARAVAMKPAVLLMDEPLSNLDALLRLTFRAELKRLVAELNTTTIYVTHDQVEALSLGDRIAVMNRGRIVQCDVPTTVYSEPVSQFVGGFIGNPPMNFLRGRVHPQGGGGRGGPTVEIEGHHVDLVDADLLGVGQPGTDGELTVGIRAENIRAELEESPGAVPARVHVVEPVGAGQLLTVAVGSQLIKVTTPTDFPAKPDEDLWLHLEPSKLRLFPADADGRMDTSDREAAAAS
jgi:multiple sugar transport system ATP-binding protein